MKMNAEGALMRHGCEETEQAPARKKASATNKKLMFTFTQTFVEMIFQDAGLELLSFCLERKGYSLDMKRKLMSHSEQCSTKEISTGF